jgi:TPP-dependent pyruvate/acetoin dehydrogenase alpha subunit
VAIGIHSLRLRHLAAGAGGVLVGSLLVRRRTWRRRARTPASTTGPAPVGLAAVAHDAGRVGVEMHEDAERPTLVTGRDAGAVEAAGLDADGVGAAEMSANGRGAAAPDVIAQHGERPRHSVLLAHDRPMVHEAADPQGRGRPDDRDDTGVIRGDDPGKVGATDAEQPSAEGTDERHGGDVEHAGEQEGGDVAGFETLERKGVEQERVPDGERGEGGPQPSPAQTPAQATPPHEPRVTCEPGDDERRPRLGVEERSGGDPAPEQEEEGSPDLATTTPEPSTVGEHLSDADRVELLRHMLLMRSIEERAMTLYRQGKVPGSFYDGYGQEAVSVGAAFAMAAEDRFCILHRDLGAHLVRGVTPARIFAQYMGRADGITGGRDGNVHFGDWRVGCVGMVSMLPDMMLVATGMAMAFRLRDERRAAITWFGDGSTSRGDFHEAMNWAGVQRLPVIFVLENNQYAYSTPTAEQFAVNPVERAQAYGFQGVTVDGNDVEAMFEATRQARAKAVRGDGPTLIEAVTMRMHGHAAHDDMKYVPKEQIEEWRAKDPIDRQDARLREAGVDVDALRAEVKQAIDGAVEEALTSPMPDPATATEGVFCEGDPNELEDGNAPWSGWAADR